MKQTKRMTTALASAAIIAAIGGVASATMITEPVALTLENVGQPQNFYSSLLLFPVDQQGNPLETAFFDTNVVPGVFIGDETSNTPRTIAGYAYIDDFGDPGDLLLRIDFPENDPWSPDEMLTFTFSLNYEEGTLWKIDIQLTTIPAPGALAAFAAAGFLGRRRRR